MFSKAAIKKASPNQLKMKSTHCCNLTIYFLAFPYFLSIPEDKSDLAFLLHIEPLISQLHGIPNNTFWPSDQVTTSCSSYWLKHLGEFTTYCTLEATRSSANVVPAVVASSLPWYKTSLFTSVYVSTSAFPCLQKSYYLNSGELFFFWKCINAFIQLILRISSSKLVSMFKKASWTLEEM